MSEVLSPVNPGEVVGGKYEIRRIIGQGGMGVVVAAWHLQLEQTVAIKFLLRDASSTGLERFMREAKAAALVKSEHACRVHDFGKLESGEPYLVMEYLEGSDLADKLDAEGPQPIESVANWVIQACDALSSAHAQGMVHRDLKPANLFLHQNDDGSSILKVVDFGISKLTTGAALTSTAVLMGSPLYMSPEQLVSSRDVDPRSDIWSVGVVLYELLTGVPPFVSDSLVQIAVLVRECEPEPLADLRPEIPPGLERVVMKCLAKAAGDRYANVNALAVDLAPFAGPEASAIVQKLGKRAGRSSDPRLVLSKTQAAPDPAAGARSAQKTRNDTPNSRGERLTPPSERYAASVEGKTPSDVELELVSVKQPRRLSRALFGAGIGAVALVAVGTFALRATTGSVPKSAIEQEATTLSAPLDAGATVGPAKVRPAEADSGLANVGPPPDAGANVGPGPSANVGPGPSANVGPAVRPHPVPHPSAAPVASAVVAPPPSASGPKRRDVDRDYQP